MTFLPIVARELRVASRRRSTYWLRCAAALSVLVIGAWFFLMMQHQQPQEISVALFGILTGTAVLYCLLSGVRSTADCLSEEKREGTLGLLFLTDLKGYDVVVGKLAATSLNAFYGVLGVLPMLAIPLLLGGITLGEFGRMALVVVNTLFFSLALGICVSALCRSARKSAGITLLLLFLVSGFLPACGAWLAAQGKIRPLAPVFYFPSPGFTYYLAFDQPFKAARAPFWWSLVVVHALGWIFLAVASLVAPRSWQDRPAGTQQLRWRERWQYWSYGSLAERTGFRRRLLNSNAFYWLAARLRLKPACVWAVLGLVACVWAWGLAKLGREWLNEGVYVTTAVVLNILLKAWFATEAGRQLAEDRQHGALELLLSTSLTVQDIVRGQFLALKRQFLGPVLSVLALYFLFMVATVSNAMVEADHAFWALLWSGAMAMMVADLAALFWVGLWQGVTAKSPQRAATESLARILVLPWVGMAVAMLAVSLAAIAGQYEPTGKFFLVLWFMLGLAADLGFGAWARYRFLRDFRRAAAQKYLPQRGFWKRFVTGDGYGAS